MSETTNLKLFKHDSPETNENQFDIETSLNENWDKIDEHFGENRKRIIELEAEKQRLKEDLKGLPTGTFSDESIHLNDSADMRLHELKISGNSKQETRSGKNKFDLKTWFKNTTSSQSTKILLDNGVQLNFDVGADAFIGYIVTSTGTVLSESYRKQLIEIEASKEYTLSLSSSPKCYIGFFDENYTSLGYTAIPSNYNKTSYTFTTPSQGKYITIRLGIKDENYTSYSFTNIQLEEGSVATEYELYGVSPSPEYPSEVKSCDDNVNLFDKDTGIKRSKYIGANGEIVNDVNLFYQENYIKVFPNTSYVISAKNGEAFRIAEYDSNKDFIKRTYNVNSISNKFNIVTSENCHFIRLSCNINNLDSIKFEQNSTPTPYSKFGQGNISFEMCNKNISTVLNLDIDWILTENGIKNSNKNTGIQVIKFNLKKKQKAKISFKRITSLQNDTSFTARINDVSNSDISFIGVQKDIYLSKNTFEYIATEDCTIIYTMWGNSNNEKFEFQFWVELDETNDYEPHKSQTYTIPTQKALRKIDTYKDTFIRKNGKWYERHCINRIVFDGTENWESNMNIGWIQNNHIFGIIVENVENNGQTTNVGNVLISSHFLCINTGNLVANAENCISYYPHNKCILINNQSINNLQDFKTWLSEQYNTGKPVYVDYVLKNSEDIECTAEQSEILNKIENEAKTYKGITHIYSTDEISPNFDGIYFKDIEMMIQGGK